MRTWGATSDRGLDTLALGWFELWLWPRPREECRWHERASERLRRRRRATFAWLPRSPHIDPPTSHHHHHHHRVVAVVDLTIRATKRWAARPWLAARAIFRPRASDGRTSAPSWRTSDSRRYATRTCVPCSSSCCRSASKPSLQMLPLHALSPMTFRVCVAPRHDRAVSTTDQPIDTHVHVHQVAWYRCLTWRHFWRASLRLHDTWSKPS